MSLGKHILILVMLFIGAFNAFASDNDYIIYSRYSISVPQPNWSKAPLFVP